MSEGDKGGSESVPVVQGVLLEENVSPDRFRDDDEGVLPPIVERDGPASIVSTEVEAHTVLSACVLVSAVGCDALTARDLASGSPDCPSSFRISSLVMVCMMASPGLRGINIIDQRVSLAAALVALAYFGTHSASEEVRTGDCVFCTLVLLMAVQIYKSGGIETEDVRPDSVQDKPHRRQTMAALCASLMVYVGARGLMDAFHYGRVASDYEVEYATVSGTSTAKGYSHATTSVSVPLGFGHGVILSTGLLIALHDETRVVGSSAVAFEVGSAGLAACVAALWCLLGQSTSIDNNMVLYGPGSCGGGEDECFQAARARRLLIVNGSSATLWMAGLSALVFSFAVEKRFLNSRFTQAESMWQGKGFGIALAFAAAAVFGVYQYGQFQGSEWHTDVCTVASLVAVFVSSVSNTVAGTAVYVAAMTYEQYQLMRIYGVDAVLAHLTHCTLIMSLLLMWVHVALMLLKDVLLWRWQLDDSSRINSLMGVVSALGTSLTFGLYMASTVLLAASNGRMPQEDGDLFRGGSPARSMIAFALDHFVPFFIWMPLFACRCEVNLISAWNRAFAWLLAVPLDALIYVIVLSAVGKSAPVVSIMQLSGAGVVGSGALVAWVVGAFV